MDAVHILSVIGLYMVEASYLPQLWRLYKLKEAEEFSLLFPSLNFAGRLCGLVYSILAHQPTFGWFFAIGMALRAALMFQVVYYRLRKRRTLKHLVGEPGVAQTA